MVVVAENHTMVGGLGEAVAGVLLRAGHRAQAFRQIALPDEFLTPARCRRCTTATASRPRDGAAASRAGSRQGRQSAAAPRVQAPNQERRLASTPPGATAAP